MKDYVIVTGGAGYIGSHICKALKQQGYSPVVIDRLDRGHRDFVQWGPLIVGEVGDRKLLQNSFAAYRPRAVIHCAGYICVPESVMKPDLYYRNNVADSMVLLEEMKHFGIENIIFSSSCAVYGDAEGALLTEDHLQAPINPYGHSKKMVEQIIQDMARSYPLRYAILRYFNAAGADPDYEIGELHHPETHLIPLMLDAASESSAFKVYGNDYPTPDGSAIRDFVHVSDLAEGHVKALQLLEKTSQSFAVNLGSGRGTSVKEMVRWAEKITGMKIPIQSSDRRPGDPPLLVADVTTARKLLGWNPRFSIEEIVSTAWQWHQKNNEKNRIME
jgi:UDP-arabinose 4-epimerase